MTSLIQDSQAEINELCQKVGIRSLAVFGSQVRGDQRANSDVDLLVEFERTPGLVGFIQIKHQLETIFNRKVDLITKNGISKYLLPSIQKDLQIIYG